MLKKVLLLGTCLALTACFGGGDSKEFLIDNPTGKPLAISVDDQKSRLRQSNHKRLNWTRASIR